MSNRPKATKRELADMARRILNPQDLNDAVLSVAWDKVVEGACKQLEQHQLEQQKRDASQN